MVLRFELLRILGFHVRFLSILSLLQMIVTGLCLFPIFLRSMMIIFRVGIWSWPVRTNFLPVDAELIQNIHVGMFRSDDQLIWNYDSKGKFSVKSGYFLAMKAKKSGDLSEGSADRRWWDCLWHLKIPEKIKIFVWRAFHNILPTWKNQAGREVGCSEGCGRCFNDKETTFHALISSNAAMRI